jgi:hypothetical protein
VHQWRFVTVIQDERAGSANLIGTGELDASCPRDNRAMNGRNAARWRRSSVGVVEAGENRCPVSTLINADYRLVSQWTNWLRQRH